MYMPWCTIGERSAAGVLETSTVAYIDTRSRFGDLQTIIRHKSAHEFQRKKPPEVSTLSEREKK